MNRQTLLMLWTVQFDFVKINPMKPCVLIAALLPLVGGCLGTAPKAPKTWSVEWTNPALERVERAKMPAVKLLLVDVRAPYNGNRLAVLRADGSIAFDSFNSFAAQPAAILRGAVFDALEASGAFERVVSGSSVAITPLSAEITVNRLALDCRKSNQRDASVSLSLVIVSNRTVVASASAEASAAVAGGDYSTAFSKAFEDALLLAVGSIDIR